MIMDFFLHLVFVIFARIQNSNGQWEPLQGLFAPSSSIQIVPLGCALFGIFCPPGYTPRPRPQPISPPLPSPPPSTTPIPRPSTAPSFPVSMAAITNTSAMQPSLLTSTPVSMATITSTNTSTMQPSLPTSTPVAVSSTGSQTSRPTTGATTSISGTECASFNLQKEQSSSIQVVNEYRKRHGAEPLTESSMLNVEAQKYAEFLATNEILEHSKPEDRKGQGENLAEFSCPDGIITANHEWYKEISIYCPGGGPSKLPAAGHFTQMVWKRSKSIGQGAAVGKNGNIYVVARYTPAGNVNSESAFNTNVQCQ